MALFSRTIFRSCPALTSRSFHASSSLHDEFKKLMFRLNGFNKYGLLADDLLRDLDPDCFEAIRRLPEDEQMQRKYRAIRASQANVNNCILPKEQWTKFEDVSFSNEFYSFTLINAGRTLELSSFEKASASEEKLTEEDTRLPEVVEVMKLRGLQMIRTGQIHLATFTENSTFLPQKLPLSEIINF